MHCQKLIGENRIVRIARSLYTTPARAFETIDTKTVCEFMDSIIRNAGRPLECDVLRERINEHLRMSYSKYYYGAFARTHAHEFNWHVRKTLCSDRCIPWDGLKDAFRSIFDSSRSKTANLLAFRKSLFVNDRIANGMIAGWMSKEQSELSEPSEEDTYNCDLWG